MKKHLYEAIYVTFVEISSRVNGTWKNIYKKAQRFTPPYYLDVDSPMVYQHQEILDTQQ